jgi:NAD(P)-dependent dehydrogenase (short-subunit alcohol dehydrogenase family)
MSTESVTAPVALVTVTSDESVRPAAGCVEQAGGHLDVLVNNPGITGPVRDPHDYTADDMTEAVALFIRS